MLVSKIIRRVASILLLGLSVASPLQAQIENQVPGVAVKIKGQGDAWEDGTRTLSIWGTFLPTSPTANDGTPSPATGSASNEPVKVVLGAHGFVRVEPGVTYKVHSSGDGIDEAHIDIVAPPGYRVVMDGMIRTRRHILAGETVVFQLLPAGLRHPGIAGKASSVAADEFEWRLSLGSLRNGGSAGELLFIDNAQRADLTSAFRPQSLYYEPVGSEISVLRENDAIRRIVANQVVVDVVTLSSVSFEIRCYHPSQASITGQPYVAYRIERADTTPTLKITKFVRNVSATNLNAGVARQEELTLSRSGTYPDYTWTKRDWHLGGESTAASEVVSASVSSGGVRTETVSVRPVGSSTTHLSIVREHTKPASSNGQMLGEVMTKETLGDSAPLETTFDYYKETSDFGSFGLVKSISLPGGGWVAYDYFAENPSEDDPGGRVKTEYRPHLTGPAGPTWSNTGTETVHTTYTLDAFGAKARPGSTETKINGVTVAKSVFGYFDTSDEITITRTDFAAAGQELVTKTRRHSENHSDAFVRNRPYKITTPDGVRKEFEYHYGSWNGTTFVESTASTHGAGADVGTRVTVVTGVGGYTAGVLPGSANFEPIWLVDGKSTREVTIRDRRALVIRTESSLWKDGAWQVVGFTDSSYDYAGNLVNRVGHNGATYTAVYDGGLKTSETDENGITTNFDYDVLGRVSVATRTSATAGGTTIPALATKYTYDALKRVVEEQVGWGQANPIVTARTYDRAGRLASEAPPGNYGAVTYTYNPTTRTETKLRADNGTVVSTFYLDGRLLSTTGTAAIHQFHTYDANSSDGTRWHRIDTGSANSPRWTKTTVDWLGREKTAQQPGFTGQPLVETGKHYNAKGQLWKTTRTGHPATLVDYDLLGQPLRSGLDFDGSNTLVATSGDRITETESFLEQHQGAWWLRTEERAFPFANSDRVQFTAVKRVRLTGFSPAGRLAETQTIDIEGNVTVVTSDVNRSARTRTTTTSRTGLAAAAVEQAVNGLAVSATGHDQLTTSTAYDSYLRPWTVTDSRGKTTTTTYVTGTKLISTVANHANQTTVTAYDALGRVAWTRDAKNAYTRFAYSARDELVRQWGDGAMPVEYGYHATYGGRTSMSTFRGGTGWGGAAWPGTAGSESGSSPGTADTVAWVLDAPSGLLERKTYPRPDPAQPEGAGNLPRSVVYAYNERGQTATRTWGRGLVTTFNYDPTTREPVGESYADSTPAVTYARNGRTGQIETVNDFTTQGTFTGLRDFVYDPVRPWRLDAEAMGSFYGGRIVTRLHEETGVIGRMRGVRVGAAAGSASDLEQTLGYTAAGRVETVGSNRQTGHDPRTFRYGYHSQAALVTGVTVDGNTSFAHSRIYDSHWNLPTTVASAWGSAVRTSFVYTYDERGQRVDAVQTGTAFEDHGSAITHQYAYNPRGELTHATAYLGATIVAGQQLGGRMHEYDYDPAGNRVKSNRTGNSELRDDYAANALNQYRTRENNTLTISGTMAATGNATVAGGTLPPQKAGRRGKWWNDDVTLNNAVNPAAPNPWRGPVSVYAASGGQYRSETRMAEIGPRVQTFAYDADGNLTEDGVQTYTWDGENRLIRIETDEAATTWNLPRRALELRYDYLGRRVLKQVWTRASAGVAWQLEAERRYLYDGWKVVAEYAPQPGGALVPVRTYTWGLDIAGTLANAGGVGALLQIADHPSGKTYWPAYDGNGNIVALMNSSTGAVAAVYEYGPYGEAIRAEAVDQVVADQPFRFSTKWTDVETGMVYYGRRYYSPSQGRFLGRDPIEEQGGLNLYGFCGNNGINSWDYLGCISFDDMMAALKGMAQTVANFIKSSVSSWGEQDDDAVLDTAINESNIAYYYNTFFGAATTAGPPRGSSTTTSPVSGPSPPTAAEAAAIAGAGAVMQKITEAVRSDPNGIVQLTAAEFSAVMDYYAYTVNGYRADGKGMKDMTDKQFEDYLKIFADTMFNHVRNPSDYSKTLLTGNLRIQIEGQSGTHMARDINYVLQGMARVARGGDALAPTTHLDTFGSIVYWNVGDFLGSGATYNLTQIGPAFNWATYGIDYYAYRYLPESARRGLDPSATPPLPTP